jgi:hypothetical protein
MSKYGDLNKDPEVSTAITVLTDMVVGVGFYTQMPEEEEQGDEHPNKAVVDEWAENENLDELLSQIVRLRYEYGFCPVERLSQNRWKVLQPEYFFCHWDQKGNLKSYSQRKSESDSALATWSLNQIVRFVRKESPANPYGEALVDPIAQQIEARNEINSSLPDVIGNIAYPFRLFRGDTDAIRDVLYDQVTGRDVFENVFIGNVREDQMSVSEVATDPRFNPTPMLEHMDFQISEGLFAPLLMYLRNATEASATKMLEAIDRHIEGEQRYVKRRVERFMFQPLVGDPVPRLMWGSPEPQMEEVSLTDIATLLMSSVPRIMSVPEARTLLRGYVDLEDGPLDEEQPEQELPVQPFQQLPFNQRKGLDMSLATLQQAFDTKKLSLTETFREAHHVLDAYIDKEKQKALGLMSESMRRQLTKLSPETETYFSILRNELFNAFREKVLPLDVKVGAGRDRNFKVTVE